MARPAGGGSGGGGGPAGAGPYWWSSGAWVTADSADLPGTLLSTVSSLSGTVGTLTTSVGSAQTAITTLQAAGYTLESFPSFVVGSAPTYTVLKTLTIAPGTSRVFTGVILVTGGDAATPTSGGLSCEGTAYIQARRGSGGGAPTINGAMSAGTGTVSSLAGRLAVTGNDITVELRATSGPTCNVVMLYRWLLGGPP